MSSPTFLNIDKVVMIKVSITCLHGIVVAFSECHSLSMSVTMPNSCQNAIGIIIYFQILFSFTSYTKSRNLQNNLITNVEAGAFSGLAALTYLLDCCYNY